MDAIKIIRNNLLRAYRDHYPNSDHDVAVYNDLLREIDPNLAFTIDYYGNNNYRIQFPHTTKGVIDGN